MISASLSMPILRMRALPSVASRTRRVINRALSTDTFFISKSSKSQPVQVSRASISQSRERVLSGIQPTGVPHIGAYPTRIHLLPLTYPAQAVFRPHFLCVIRILCRQLFRRSEAMGFIAVRRAGLPDYICFAVANQGSRTRTLCPVCTALSTFTP